MKRILPVRKYDGMPGTDIRFTLRSVFMFPGTTKTVRTRITQRRGGKEKARGNWLT
ncbi:hypothetical protein QUF72_13555 [Desulfobacterales bacterium HSG2]|nr:hypothetical protein [Desulfobacterales bacterium HSG2]